MPDFNQCECCGGVAREILSPNIENSLLVGSKQELGRKKICTEVLKT